MGETYQPSDEAKKAALDAMAEVTRTALTTADFNADPVGAALAAALAIEKPRIEAETRGQVEQEMRDNYSAVLCGRRTREVPARRTRLSMYVPRRSKGRPGMSDRLQELADISDARPLTPEELAEAFDLSVGAETVEDVEAFLAEEDRE